MLDLGHGVKAKIFDLDLATKDLGLDSFHSGLDLAELELN